MNKRYYSCSRIHPMSHPYALGSELKSVLGEAAMGIASKAINPNGNKTVMSDGLNTIGDLAGMVPGYGTAAKYIIKGLNAVGNAAFGSNVDYAAVNGLGADLDAAQLGIGSSTTVDTLRSSMEDLDDINVLGADLGSQGWFNKDVDIQRNQLLAQQKRARAAAQYAYNNINTLGLRNMMGTALADGGSIDIKDSKKGTFQALATRKGMSMGALSKDIQAHPDNYSEAARKKELFYRNFVHKHDEGGPIFKTDYDMGLTFVNAGGTHEQNPYGGVFMGIAPDGQPNQVEEGEVVIDVPQLGGPYVMSNRLVVPKATRKKYKMRETEPLTFADAIKDYIKKNGIEERNNDPIANRGLEAFASELAMEQEMIHAKKKMRNSRQAANGGHLFPDGGRPYIGYNREEEAPDYTDMTSDYMRAINWLRDPANERWRKQLQLDITNGVYDDPNGPKRINGVKIDDSNWYNLATDGKVGPVHNAIMKWANANRALWDEVPSINDTNPVKNGVLFSRPSTYFGNDGVYTLDKPLADTSLTVNMATGKGGLHYNPEGKLAGVPAEGTVSTTEGGSSTETDTYDPTYWWRMAGLGANAAGLMYNLLDPYHPQVVNEARAPRTINPRYLGDYISYSPYDINYATSQQDANTAALRNALMQSNAPIRNASLLANDFNNNATRGTTRRQALEYNDALRKAVADFNRGTNQFNAQMFVDAATKNQAARQAYYQDRLRQAQFNSQLDFQHKMMRDQAIGQGITGIADYLNDMARENVARAGAEVYASTMPTKNTEAEEYTKLISPRKTKTRRSR